MHPCSCPLVLFVARRLHATSQLSDDDVFDVWSFKRGDVGKRMLWLLSNFRCKSDLTFCKDVHKMNHFVNS